jgi:RTX calcium-binding nonapeptide repeat (4 copies)
VSRERSLGRATALGVTVLVLALIAGLAPALTIPAAAQDPVEECHEGTASLTAPVSGDVALFGCVFDAFHNGVPNVPVIWRLNTTGMFPPAFDDPAHFVNVPEQITGPDGRAHAVVGAHPIAAGHLTNLFFCTDLDRNGICDQQGRLQALLQISWVHSPCAIGSGAPETLSGTAGSDCIRGLGGADRLLGRRGGDVLFGGPGPDVMRGGPGPDSLFGGSGMDVCYGQSDDDVFIGCEVVRTR